ncbi:unnamed protein product [Rotaria sp. Silwood2]|nr:unnamed protein product [Rotaria sp. Silwood2]CAF2822911.1 unnamed protein product [Rotaria sp. Silwood2]CAF3143060.1 unnamed protein product [Rotaria sp. Silwood2]CAF3267577.1 unnamed protein product [Rotaria sp. Silwood2]CAF4135815.1 unnamed protein product [Rotaria sp. Silwood2]
MNTTCSQPLLWSQAIIDNAKPQLYASIIALFTHLIFWLQIIFCSSLRQKSLQWIYSYLITDILLLAHFFFSYFVHTTSTNCKPSRSWVLFICYFEAALDNYLNITEVYILLALNICRYIRIAYNRNVYQVHMKVLILTEFGIFLIPLIIFILEFLFGWTEIKELIRDSCDVFYTNIYIQIFNTIFGYALPMFLNMLVIYAGIRHIHLASTLQRTQHHVSAREKYHHSLVIQFLCFYLIWGGLWSPYVIISQVSFNNQNVMNTVTLLSFIQIAFDPIIIAALDVRFWHEWRKVYFHVKNTIFFTRLNHGRIQPLTVNLN